MKRILAVLIAAVMLLSAASALAEPFRVGMECAYAPFNWQQTEADENSVPIDGGVGYAGGYDVEIARRIADGLGRELVIVKLEWDGLIPALQSNMIDAVIAGNMGGEAKALLLSYGIIPIVGYCGSADDAADLLITGRLPIVDPGAGMGFGGGCSGSCGGCSGCGTSNEGCACGDDSGSCGCGCH